MCRSGFRGKCFLEITSLSAAAPERGESSLVSALAPKPLGNAFRVGVGCHLPFQYDDVCLHIMRTQEFWQGDKLESCVSSSG